jgi:hypothetical protein
MAHASVPYDNVGLMKACHIYGMYVALFSVLCGSTQSSSCTRCAAQNVPSFNKFEVSNACQITTCVHATAVLHFS